MNSANSDLCSQLEQAWAEETCQLLLIREACAAADPSWIDDPALRDQRMGSIKKLTAKLITLQKTSQALAQSCVDIELGRSLPQELGPAKESHDQALASAMAAVRRLEVRATDSKSNLLDYLAKTNQTHEMMGAYRER